MLSELTIQDIVLIDRVRLSVGAGLTALTGETGAGKSILLDSLGLALGGRADRALVRQGAPRGMVAATFDVPRTHAAFALLEEGGIDPEDDTITLRRVQEADGRSRAFINDQPVSIGLLRAVGETLIEVHGQHQSLGFLNVQAHRGLLDAFGGLCARADTVRQLWQARRAADAALTAIATARETASREADYLQHAATELRALAPVPGEEGTLAAERARLKALERVASDIADGISALDDDAATRRLRQAVSQISRAAGRLEGEDGAALKDAAAATEDALGTLREATAQLADLALALGADAEALNAAEVRLFALRAAGRKYGCAPDGLAAHLEAIEARLAGLGADAAAETAARRQLGTAEREYMAAATALSADRLRAARQLEVAVQRELAPLRLGQAVFSVSVVPQPDVFQESGFDRISFEIATNPGTRPAPLADIASGGELARIVLALKAVLVARTARTVIIFDEVDAGLGGAVAEAVGERLARIAASAQVLVVTHSPQVAACASTHWRVEKSGRKRATTSVVELDVAARTEELARMLSGAVITDEARAAAMTLLRTQAGRRAA